MMWKEIVEKAANAAGMRKIVFQEEMQKTVLAALALKGCFDSIVFHGGTALRLFYGNPRYSEDIDFVLKEGGKRFDLSVLLPHIERFAHDRFPFLNSVKAAIQKNEPDLQRAILRTHSNDGDRNLRVHIEIASVPSYRSGPKILDLPPLQPAVMVEDPSEILADKVSALALRPYLKGRDLWDIYYLNKERSLDIEWELVRKKVRDYEAPASGLEEGFERVKERIMDEGEAVLDNELQRFLPAQVFRHYRSSYDLILGSVVEIISGYHPEQGV